MSHDHAYELYVLTRGRNKGMQYGTGTVPVPVLYEQNRGICSLR